MLSKIIIVGDRDTCLGFSLAGVAEARETVPENADAVISELLASSQAGIVIVTSDLMSALSHKVRKAVAETVKPVVIEIPGKNAGASAGSESINAMVKKAIGIDLK